jgi:hypothetical protein
MEMTSRLEQEKYATRAKTTVNEGRVTAASGGGSSSPSSWQTICDHFRAKGHVNLL